MSSADPVGETQHAPAALVAGRYEILGLLGAGAMGTVYRARDRELDEIVALKVLKKELATPDMLERFRREVKLARRVTHANVARTFDIGETGGDRFLTMELVEGEMLAALLARKKRLTASETIKVGLDVCAGLSAAHAANVLHRDLKPENVIVAKDGRAVITDFGIARAVAADAARTAAGIVGTPAYMAPEQVEGGDLDARADLYALGTMLYELLTGELAWNGETIISVATSRLLRPPPDVRGLLPTVPTELADLVLRLMARRREDRFESADETASALRAALAATTPSQRALPIAHAGGTLRLPRVSRGGRAVAVLPPASGAAEDAYLVDGLHEDVVDLLSVVPGLAVRPRGDTARFRGGDRDVHAIGRALGADVIVDGSFRRIESSVRVTFRLIAVEDGFQLWARRFDRPAAQLLAIADEAAEAIAHALTTELQPRGRVIAAAPEAEDLFLRGRWHLRRGWNDSVAEAADLLARAHRLAPEDRRIAAAFALASARAFGLQTHGTAGEQARTLATEVLAADPSQVDARCALGVLCFNLHAGEEALRHFRMALSLAPNSIDALDWAGRLLGEVGLVDEGIALLQRAIAIDPEFIVPAHQIARLRMLIGDSEGVRAMGEMPAHVGDIAAWTIVRGRDALWRGDVATGRALRERLATTELPAPVRFALDSYLLVVSGEGARIMADRAFVERMLPIDRAAGPRRASFHAQLHAELYAAVGRHEEALAAVADADVNGLLDIVWLDRCPLLDPLRSALEGIRGRVAARAERVVRVYRSG